MIKLSSLQPEIKPILKHFVNHGFVKFQTLNNTLQRLIYGPLGEILRENIRKEWILGNSTYRENNVFPYHCRSSDDFISDIKDAYTIGKELNGNSLPFGLSDSRKTVNVKSEEVLLPRNNTELRYYGFFDHEEGKQFYYRWTQQRKRWWRKFSLDPGKFSISEIEKDEALNTEEMKVLASFPWGVHKVESIRFLNDAPFQNQGSAQAKIFKFSNGSTKRVFPHVIESVCSLDYALVTYLLDSYNLTGESKVICRFHRKLAPYKFAFAASQVDEVVALGLFEMSQMMCFDLMKAGLNCLLPVKSVFGKVSLDTQIEKYNSIGVPYTAVLTDRTLNSGIFGLYSRETSLQEDLHVDKFKDYGALLMKNY